MRMSPVLPTGVKVHDDQLRRPKMRRARAKSTVMSRRRKPQAGLRMPTSSATTTPMVASTAGLIWMLKGTTGAGLLWWR